MPREYSDRWNDYVIVVQGQTKGRSRSGRDERRWQCYLTTKWRGRELYLKVGKTSTNGAGSPPAWSDVHQLEREAIAAVQLLGGSGEWLPWSRTGQDALEALFYRWERSGRVKLVGYPEVERVAPVPKHRAVLLLGPHHSGKTTLLHAAAGLSVDSDRVDLIRDGGWVPQSLTELGQLKPWLQARDGHVYGPAGARYPRAKLLSTGLAVVDLDSHNDLNASFFLHHLLTERPVLTEVNVSEHRPWDHYSPEVRERLVPVLVGPYTVEELAWFVQQRCPELPLDCGCEVRCRGRCSWKPECTCQCAVEAHHRQTVLNRAREDAYRQYLNYPRVEETFKGRVEHLVARNLGEQVAELREIVRRWWKDPTCTSAS